MLHQHCAIKRTYLSWFNQHRFHHQSHVSADAKLFESTKNIIFSFTVKFFQIAKFQSFSIFSEIQNHPQTASPNVTLDTDSSLTTRVVTPLKPFIRLHHLTLPKPLI